MSEQDFFKQMILARDRNAQKAKPPAPNPVKGVHSAIDAIQYGLKSNLTDPIFEALDMLETVKSQIK